MKKSIKKLGKESFKTSKCFELVNFLMDNYEYDFNPLIQQNPIVKSLVIESMKDYDLDLEDVEEIFDEEKENNKFGKNFIKVGQNYVSEYLDVDIKKSEVDRGDDEREFFDITITDLLFEEVQDLLQFYQEKII